MLLLSNSESLDRLVLVSFYHDKCECCQIIQLGIVCEGCWHGGIRGWYAGDLFIKSVVSKMSDSVLASYSEDTICMFQQ